MLTFQDLQYTWMPFFCVKIPEVERDAHLIMKYTCIYSISYKKQNKKSVFSCQEG